MCIAEAPPDVRVKFGLPAIHVVRPKELARTHICSFDGSVFSVAVAAGDR